MRKQVVAGNWKMNKTSSETTELINTLKDGINTEEKEVILFVPAINLVQAMELVRGTNISVGCQNIYFEDSGAFTGETSVKMLTDLGVKYTLVGHSERRQYFGETDVIVNRKVLKAIENNVTPVICIGESLGEREQNITFELLRSQTKIALKDVTKEAAEKLIIAYEPIWAIGTGKTATSDQAEEACREIRKVLAEIYTEDTANKIRIQYGGSVKGDNAKEIFSKENIDGGLVGGACLKAEFVDIVKA
ncbi:MAG: triose-phosphate isomerase [Lachnospirales bacterium]